MPQPPDRRLPAAEPTRPSPRRWRRLGIPGAALLLAAVALLGGWLAGPAASAASTDLACGRPATASSNSGTAGNAVDCVAGTVWQSGTTKPQQLQVDLGATVAVDHVTVVWGAGYGTSYKIRTSPDGASWHTVAQNTAGQGGTETLALPAGTSTRWVQLYLSQYAGSAGFTVDELSVYGSGPAPSASPSTSRSASPTTSPSTSPSASPSRSTSPSVSPSTSPPPGGHTWNVTDAAGLKAALAGVAPGDTIHLADGSYADQFVATRAGTAAKPITLTGSPRAVLSDPLFNPGNTSCPSGQVGYGLWLQGAAYWNLTGFTVVDSKKGIVLDGSPHVTIDGVTVHDIGYEAVHFRASSDHGIIRNSTIYNTGMEQPGYGEGVYLGSANSNWACYGAGGGPDAGDFIQVLNNHLGPNIAAEAVDIKEGTHGGVVSGNYLDGTGESNQNSADSTIDVKGDGYTISGNTVVHPLLDGFQVHNVYQSFGCGNVFTANKFTVDSASGWGINVTDQSHCSGSPNVVYASNTSSGGKGLTNISVTAGG
jgi:F5/8 type C domain